MFAKSNEPKDIQKAIDRLFKEMEVADPATEQYQILVARLGELNEIKHSKKADRITPDTALTVAGNLAGILAIINYEKLAVVTSKALPFVMKVK